MTVEPETLVTRGTRVRVRRAGKGKPVLFLHPKDFSGTLVELEQA